jgi:hypothetical protein
LVARIESSSALPRSNWFARLSVVVGVLTLTVGPVAIEVSKRSARVDLLEAVAGIAVASALLALLTLLLARRGRIAGERSLGRAGGEGLVRTGRTLGILGLCIAVAAGIALAFYVLLQVFLA